MVKKLKTKKAKVITKKEKFIYKVEVQFNGVKAICETNDLFEVLSSISPKLPEYIKTRLNISITKGKQTIEKMLLLGQAKLFFRNALSRKMFIQHLYFK